MAELSNDAESAVVYSSLELSLCNTAQAPPKEDKSKVRKKDSNIHGKSSLS